MVFAQDAKCGPCRIRARLKTAGLDRPRSARCFAASLFVIAMPVIPCKGVVTQRGGFCTAAWYTGKASHRRDRCVMAR